MCEFVLCKFGFCVNLGCVNLGFLKSKAKIGLCKSGLCKYGSGINIGFCKFGSVVNVKNVYLGGHCCPTDNLYPLFPDSCSREPFATEVAEKLCFEHVARGHNPEPKPNTSGDGQIWGSPRWIE